MNDSHNCEFLMQKIILQKLVYSLQIALKFFVNLPSSCWLRKLCYGTKLCRTMCLNLQNMKCLTCGTLVDYDKENNCNLFLVLIIIPNHFTLIIIKY
uniref:Uncharacterized protein n=1 Tax=Amphimedon queenslandica TaxID=400682 RepID=A0A1X7VST5_AMPQE